MGILAKVINYAEGLISRIYSRESGICKNMRGVWLTAMTVVLGGGTLAFASGDFHSMNRAGKILVVISLGLTLAQFLYEKRMDFALPNEKNLLRARAEGKGLSRSELEQLVVASSSEIDERFEMSRGTIFRNMLGVAAVGEIIDAVGDWVLIGVKGLVIQIMTHL